jgi:hypothetical protein
MRLKNGMAAEDATEDVVSAESAAPKAHAGHQENRNRLRLSIELPVRITVWDGQCAAAFLEATSTDFTENGIAFESNADITVGEVVLLEFLVAGERRPTDQSLARVIHRNGTSYGASFLV